ncbi:MAG: alpha/beta fold hydrolase [Betaproteobacteria bacterium]
MIGAANPEVRTAASGSAHFTYLEQGTGTPLVLLHGIGSAARSWKHQLRGLSDGFRVIAWDAPGYGGSSALTPDEPRADDYAAALAIFLRELGVERLHLVGHSLGCVIATRYARLNPARIVSLTLASIATGHAQLSAEERASLRAGRLDDLAALGPRGMAEKRGPRLVSSAADETTRRDVIETMAGVRPDGYRQAVWMLSNADTRADVREMPAQMRVHFIYGDADAITTPEQNQSVAHERPRASVHVLRGAGHALHLEQPEAFNDALLRFITSPKGGLSLC